MRIGEYEIGEKLGEGGMGEVYAATHVRLGSRHALKLFTRPAAGADDLRARFEQEGRLLARLRHPRVVRVTDFGADAADGRPYEVQGTLKSLLQHHSSKASNLQCSAFFIVQLSHPYMATGKTIALIRQTFFWRSNVSAFQYPV